jgi:prophage regulatory protein
MRLDLMGIAEIAEMLGVTRQRVDAITRTHAAFPAPVAELASGRIWLRKDVETWARKTGRL